MFAARKFVGIIGGKEKTFAAGAPITKKQADELNLAAKPELLGKTKNETKRSDDDLN